VHESAVDVGIEQVGHGEHSAVAQRAQVAARTLARLSVRLLLGGFLRTVVQQVHEQREVPAADDEKTRTMIQKPLAAWLSG